MAQAKFNIEILTVSQPTYTKTAKGGYNQIEVAFKKDGKVDGKKLIDFKYPEVYNAARALKQGDKAVVVSEKGENDKYWNWTSLSTQAGSPTEQPAEQESVPAEASGSESTATGSRGSATGRGRVTGSNYETPQERAKRQVYIVRQSSITAAIEFLKDNGGTESVEKVIETARQFETYVFEKPAKKEKPEGKFDDMEDDIPF